MTRENGLDEEIITEQASVSTSHSPGKLSQEPPQKADTQQRKEKEENTQVLPYYKLYSFADLTDFVLIGVGTIAAIGNGICMPLLTLLMGNLVNAFGQNSNIKQVVDEVSKVSLNFVFLAIGAGAVGFIQMACWVVTGERQAVRIRSLYLKTMLRQDVGFFDTETHTGEIIERMSGDIVLIQNAMGEKVGKLIQQIATFIAGFVVAFVKGWLLTLVLLSCIPPLFISGAFMTIVMGKLAARGQSAYSLAATVSQQTIGAIRTVASFNGEKQAVAKYNESLTKAYKSGVQEGLASGLGIGSVNFVLYSSYSLAVWFGGKMILEKGYSGGDVISVIFAVMTGSFSLGQTSQSISALGPGQAAAYKLFEEIRAAAELANAAKFIDKLPQGLDTIVGELGIQLSGGQKQRVAIARAILKDPRILLLDEATSALDAESERTVQEALDRIMINRTTIVVAHRLSTVKNADMIAVIHQGKIVEKGTQSELVKDPNGAYSQLIRLQETRMVSEQKLANDQERPEISVDSERHSSQQLSLLRSISRGSSGNGNSGRQSISVSFGVPNGIDVLETAPAEAEPHTSSGLSKNSKPPPEVPLSRVAYLNKPEIPVLLLGTIAAGFIGLVLPIFGIMLSSVIKSFFEPVDELRKHTQFWAFMYFLLAVACLLAQPLKSYFFSVAGCKLISRIRLMCFEKVVHMEISWFDEPHHSSGAIGARLSADSASFRRVVGDALSLLVQNIATLIAGLVVAFETNWQMALAVSMLLPLIAANGYIHMKFLSGSNSDAKNMYEESSQVANDAVGSIRTVASFCAEEKVMELYKKKCEGPIKAGMKQGVTGGVGFGLSFFLLFLFYAGTFYAGARLVEAGRATFPEVFRVFYALFLAATGISQSGFLAPDASKAKSAVASVFAILDRKLKIDSSDESGTIIERVKGDIEFQHVSFAYPTRPYIQIFRDLCLVIRSGKTVALIGESGSGKSTVISLLERFYDPDSGHITLDGIEIQKLQLKWLRQKMGLVSQEPVLFNDTIRANIAYGKEGNATEAEILATAELANAHKFISSLKQGYDTLVGERGIQLSGGQKQRVAIARAIVKEPKILLLDEATSALDAESERVVQDALDQVMVGRTTIMVAHRLSTIKGADLIAVVKNGIIAEKGKHETLVNIKDGLYASLVALHTSASS